MYVCILHHSIYLFKIFITPSGMWLISVPQPEIKPSPSATEAWSFNHIPSWKSQKETSVLDFYIQRVLETMPLTFHSVPGADYTSNLSLHFPSWKTQILSVYILRYSSPNHFIVFPFLQSYSSSCLPTTWRCLSKAKRSHDFVQW